jgi:hypothetical protein
MKYLLSILIVFICLTINAQTITSNTIVEQTTLDNTSPGLYRSPWRYNRQDSTLYRWNYNTLVWEPFPSTSGAADGVTTAGTYNQVSNTFDFTVAAPGSNFSVPVTGISTAIEFSTWDQNAADDFDGVWSSLTSVPAGFADNVDDEGTDDQTATEVPYDNSSSGLATSTVQGAIDLLENEIDAVSSGASDGVATAGTLDVGNNEIDMTVAAPGSNFSISLTNIETLPGFSGWDTDVSDDFSGSWNDLTNIPVGFADNTDDVNDADSNPSNELQDISLVGNDLSITSGSTVDLSGYLDDTDTQLTDEQVEDIVGSMMSGNTESLITVTYQDIDGTIDFVVQSNLSNYTNDVGFITSPNDADSNPANELQTISKVGQTVTLSNGGGSFTDDIGTDDQNATEVSYDNTSSGLVASDVQTAIDLLEEEIDAVAGGASDGVSTAGTLDVVNEEIDMTVASPGSNFSISLANIETLPSFSGWDINASDDFSGSWNDLTNIPAGFADNIDNVNDADFSTTNEIQDISLVGTDLSITSGSTVDLSTIQDGIGTDNQQVTNFALVGALLTLELEEDGQPPHVVNLASLQDGTGTDDQTLSLVTNTLSIENGNSVDLSIYLDDTNTQLSDEQVEDIVGSMLTGNTESLITVTYQDGDGTIDFAVNPNLSNYTNDVGFITSPNDADSNPSNEIQFITADFTGDFLTFSLSGGNTSNVGMYTSGVLSGNGSQNNPITLASIDDADADPANEGILSVGTGTLSTSIISSNTPGSPSITLQEGANIQLNESGNTITITSTASGADGVTTSGTLDNVNEELDFVVTGGSNFSVDISDLPAHPGFVGWDQNASDDFSGSWNDLTNIPAGFADNIDNVNDADNSVSNELQTYGHSGTTSYTNTLSLGGGSFTLLGSGATSISRSGTNVTISSTDNVNDADASTTNEGFLSVGSGTLATSIISSNTPGSPDITLQEGANIQLNESGNTIIITATDNVDDADNDPTNEGSLTVGAGDSNSSIISSNTTGSTDISLIAGQNISLSESGNSITINQVGKVTSYAPGGGTTILYFDSQNQEIIFQINMTNASTSNTITLAENPVQDPFVGGIYTFHWQNTSGGPYDIDFPNNFYDQAGALWDGGSTYEISDDFFMTCYYDGTTFIANEKTISITCIFNCFFMYTSTTWFAFSWHW